MFYTGIGSRETPKFIGAYMTHAAQVLDSVGYILRSGAANGADTFFEQGAKTKHIFLPWKGFNKNASTRYQISDEALALASEHHPAWDKLSEPARKLMGRNCYQVLGVELDTPSDFVLCWTPDGCESHLKRTSKTGGTGLAISLASKLSIPIYNLANEHSMFAMSMVLEQLQHDRLKN